MGKVGMKNAMALSGRAALGLALEDVPLSEHMYGGDAAAARQNSL
jgi:hypothetical protein